MVSSFRIAAAMALSAIAMPFAVPAIALGAEVVNVAPQEEVRARYILLNTQNDAEAIIRQLDGGADFAGLAIEKSVDRSTASAGGDLGYFVPSTMVPAFAEAVQKLKIGDYTREPVHTVFGFYVIKLEDRRKQNVPSASVKTTDGKIKLTLANGISMDLSDLTGALSWRAIFPNPGTSKTDQAFFDFTMKETSAASGDTVAFDASAFNFAAFNYFRQGRENAFGLVFFQKTTSDIKQSDVRKLISDGRSGELFKAVQQRVVNYYKSVDRKILVISKIYTDKVSGKLAIILDMITSSNVPNRTGEYYTRHIVVIDGDKSFEITLDSDFILFDVSWPVFERIYHSIRIN